MDAGDTVIVRIREHGETGRIRAKFVATVEEVRSRHELLSDMVVLDPPWSVGPSGFRLKTAAAEFEVVDDASEVTF